MAALSGCVECGHRIWPWQRSPNGIQHKACQVQWYLRFLSVLSDLSVAEIIDCKLIYGPWPLLTPAETEAARAAPPPRYIR